MEPTSTTIDEPKRRIKVSWVVEVEVGRIDFWEFWVFFVDQPWMSINLGYIPKEERQHLKSGDRLYLSIDLEPRNAQPIQSSIPGVHQDPRDGRQQSGEDRSPDQPRGSGV